MSSSLHITDRRESQAWVSTTSMADTVVTLTVLGYFTTFLLMQVLPL